MKEFDVIADWNLNKFCNFSCPYCFNTTKDRRDAAYKGNDIQKIISSFHNSEKIWLIHMSGGEPFLHPRFIDLCKGLTERHLISLNTNLSSELIYDFCKNIDPETVSFMYCSLHITERNNQRLLADFIEKVNALKQSGFAVQVTQVMWPPIVTQFKQLFDFFLKKDILVRPKIFRGGYKGGEYPQHYSRAEKNTILTFMQLSADADTSSGKNTGLINPELDRFWISGYVSFQGIPCSAGSRFVYIDFEGNIKRCQSDPKDLGNIFRGEVKLLENQRLCKTKICNCPYYGLKFASGTHTIVRSRLPLFVRKVFIRN